MADHLTELDVVEAVRLVCAASSVLLHDAGRVITDRVAVCNRLLDFSACRFFVRGGPGEFGGVSVGFYWSGNSVILTVD